VIARLLSSRSILAKQMLLAAGALIALLLMPPKNGRMLLFPHSSAAEHGMIKLAIEQGALLVGPGPVRGSFVVQGERGRLWSSMLHAGVVATAAPNSGCGSNKEARS
jgi:hypothetical protein